MATIDLIVLGMIKQQPQSAYELQRNVEYRNISRWVRISTPSIYKKVVQLEHKGYVCSEIVRTGKLSEKAVYRITDAGEKYFLDLMEQTAGESVNLFLDFNAVIMSLSLVSEQKQKELLDVIERGILELKDTAGGKLSEREHVPLTGKTILEQQIGLAACLQEWVADFKDSYVKTL